MRTNLMVTAEFETPEVGTLSVKKGTKLVKAYANSEAYDMYKKLVGTTEFDMADASKQPSEG